MKSYLPWSLAVVLFFANGSALFAAEKSEGDAGQMSIEKVVEECEGKFSEDKYPDADERNKMIDKCIDENSASAGKAAE